jgi:6-phosphogluconolactonase
MGRELATLSRDVVYQEALEAASGLLPRGARPQIEVLQDGEDLAELASRRILEVLSEGSGPVRVALAGGSTPRRLYSLLATRDLPWERLRLFLGDERAVPPDHAESNFRMVCETLLAGSPLRPDQVFRWPTELQPEAAAEAYAQALVQEFGGWPCFDLVLLGMGDDGHTASLFPESPGLEVSDRPAVANPVGGGRGWRLTLTLPALNASRRVLFLVGGEAKAAALRRVLAGEDLPAARVHGLDETLWLLDRAAWSGARG